MRAHGKGGCWLENAWHGRRSLRLSGYDHRSPGASCVTAVCQEHLPFFGRIEGDELQLNDAGHPIQRRWLGLPSRFAQVDPGEFIVMPNHLHGAIHLRRTSAKEKGDHKVRPMDRQNAPNSAPRSHGRSQRAPAWGPSAQSLGQIMEYFKSLATFRCIQHVREEGWPPFQERLWQPNYHDRILREDHGLQLIERCSRRNPARWRVDAFHPSQGM